MKRKCERCQGEISISYLLKQNSFSEIRCANCGRILEVTLLSKVLTLTYFIMVFMVISVLPLNVILKLFIDFLWILASHHYLPAFLYFYKEKNEDSLE